MNFGDLMAVPIGTNDMAAVQASCRVTIVHKCFYFKGVCETRVGLA